MAGILHILAKTGYNVINTLNSHGRWRNAEWHHEKCALPCRSARPHGRSSSVCRPLIIQEARRELVPSLSQED